MDFSEIKKFVIERGDRFIMVENGKPAVVLMSFSDYAGLCISPASRTIIPDAAETFDLPSQADGWDTVEVSETELVAEEVQPPEAQRRFDPIRSKTPLATAIPPSAERTYKVVDQIRLEDLPL